MKERDTEIYESKLSSSNLNESMTTTPGTQPMGGPPAGGGQHRSLKETFREGSPEEIKDRMKETVAKGVAAIAGALRGFNEETRKNKLPEQTRQSIHEAGETARSAISSTSQEVDSMRQPIKDAAHKIGSTARDLSKTAKEEVHKTKQPMKEATKEVGSTAREVGKTAKQEASKTKQEMKGGGQQQGSQQQGSQKGGQEPDVVVAYSETVVEEEPERKGGL